MDGYNERFTKSKIGQELDSILLVLNNHTVMLLYEKIMHPENIFRIITLIPCTSTLRSAFKG